jgi:hypothetical protein
MNEPCWGFHTSVIPATAMVVYDKEDARWFRAGPRSWRPATQAPDWDGPKYFEGWLLDEWGPVRCGSSEATLARRDDRLGELLDPVADHMTVELTPELAVRLPDAPYELLVGPGMELMRAGWMAWGAKRRRAELDSKRRRIRLAQLREAVSA